MKTLFHPLGNQSYRQGFRHGQRYPRGFGSLTGQQHRGVDYILREGHTIYAPEDGIIERLYTGQGGMTIVLRGQRYTHRLMHLSRYMIQPQSQVKMGQVIGISGNTGLSTTPHLHWDMWDRYNGELNPAIFAGFVDPHAFNIIKYLPTMSIIEIENQVANEFRDVFGSCPRTQYLQFEAGKIRKKEITIDQLKGIWRGHIKVYQKHIFNAVQYVRNYPDLHKVFVENGMIDKSVEKNYDGICNHYIQYRAKEKRTDNVLR